MRGLGNRMMGYGGFRSSGGSNRPGAQVNSASPGQQLVNTHRLGLTSGKKRRGR